MAAQLVHAAGESGPAKPGTYAVVLSAKNENELLKLEWELKSVGIPYVSIREPDPPWNGQLMAIGLRPANRKSVKGVLRRLRLLTVCKD